MGGPPSRTHSGECTAYITVYYSEIGCNGRGCAEADEERFLAALGMTAVGGAGMGTETGSGVVARKDGNGGGEGERT
jgi:hypothetical protein